MKKNRTIFLIEDDADDQEFFVEVMKEIDETIHVDLARNGAEALAKLTGTGPLPDLIFMDLNMPLMGGLECLTHLKNHPTLRIIPVIILTISLYTEERRTALALGAKLFLVKPDTYRMLRHTLTEIMNPVTDEWNDEPHFVTRNQSTSA